LGDVLAQERGTPSAGDHGEHQCCDRDPTEQPDSVCPHGDQRAGHEHEQERRELPVGIRAGNETGEVDALCVPDRQGQRDEPGDGHRASAPEASGNDGDETDHQVATDLVGQRPQRAVDEAAPTGDAVGSVGGEDIGDAMGERDREGDGAPHIGHGAVRAEGQIAAEVVMVVDPADRADDAGTEDDRHPQRRDDPGEPCPGERPGTAVQGAAADQEAAEGEEPANGEAAEGQYLRGQR
jgi:hypothetical protein